MTSSGERTSAEAEGYRTERSLMDSIPLEEVGGDQSISDLEQIIGC